MFRRRDPGGLRDVVAKAARLHLEKAPWKLISTLRRHDPGMGSPPDRFTMMEQRNRRTSPHHDIVACCLFWALQLKSASLNVLSECRQTLRRFHPRPPFQVTASGEERKGRSGRGGRSTREVGRLALCGVAQGPGQEHGFDDMVGTCCNFRVKTHRILVHDLVHDGACRYMQVHVPF